MPSKSKKRPDRYHLMVILDEADRLVLEEAAKLEKLHKAVTIRRAIRAYARKLRSQVSAAG